MLGELDQFTGQQLQCPTAAACRWLGTGGGDEQGLLLAREFAARSRARFFAERRFQVAEHKATLGPVYRRSANPDGLGDRRVAGPGIGRQQNLRAFKATRRVLAAVQQRGQLLAFGLAQFDPIA